MSAAWLDRNELHISAKVLDSRYLMRQPSYTATVANVRRGWKRSGRPAKHVVNTQWSRLANKQPWDVFYNVSRTFIAVIITLLLVCTAIDILPQSFSSGQFWNSIIVIVAMSIIAVWAIVLHLVRRVTVNRWLAALPRDHQLGRRDVGKKMRGRIEAAQQRCQELFLGQQNFAQVRHPGLQNPQMRGSPAGELLDVGVPFWKMADMLPILIEDYCTLLVPEFTRPAGASLREYLEAALYRQLLVPGAKHNVERFLLMYEQLRYSGRNITQETLFELMNAFTNILSRFQLPEGSDTRNTDSIRPSHDDTPYREEEDGGPLTLVLSEAVESSQSSYSPSVDSVRIHPTQTQDSWMSHTSHGSSTSPIAGLRLRDRLRRSGSSALSVIGFDSDEPIPGMPQRPPFVQDQEHHLLPPREDEPRSRNSSFTNSHGNGRRPSGNASNTNSATNA